MEKKAASRGSTTSDPRQEANDQPRRVQLSRAKGWRMPPNTVNVARPSRFGNPFTVEDCGRHDAVYFYRLWMTGVLYEDFWERQKQVRARAGLADLRGKNLACWCKLGDPCHADVLLELANAPLGNDPCGAKVGRAPRGAPDAEVGPGRPS